MKHIIFIILLLTSFLCATAQINTDQMTNVGRNAMYFEDYMLSIQYFNQVIAAKPYLDKPYFYRAIAKYNLDDLKGAEADVNTAIEHNPFITEAYELRGVIRQNLGRTKEAVDDYDKALVMLPENRSLLFNRSVALIELKEYDKARESFDELLSKHPSFDNGILGRAQLRLAQADTLGALEDVERAISLNRNLANAYIMRADIKMNTGSNGYAEALPDMDEAIRLTPKNAGLFINRAFLRYKLDDYSGAMNDYDHAIQLDPDNFIAHFNRAMLCAEVKDYDKALADFNEVISLRPGEYRTLYNRAIVYRDRKDYKEALADVNKVIEAFPDLAAAYFLRSDIKHAMGDRSAKKDLDKSLALAKERIKVKGKDGASDTSDLFGTPSVGDETGNAGSEDDTQSQEVVAKRFSSLLTVKDNLQVEHEYNNKSIRGRVQDRNLSVENEPLITLTYFISPTELKPSSDYIMEIDDINRRRTLRFLLQATNRESELNDPEEINKHFESIDYYNSYIATHAPRAIDFFGRAMDEMTLRNYEAALADFSKAVELTPNFTLSYFMRAIARYKLANSSAASDGSMTPMNRKAEIRLAVADIDRVIELSPMMAAAHFNKGTILLEQGDLSGAITSLNRAIELKPDFGEAFFNRGYAQLKQGNKTAGMADLSKAGELGIVASYNLLKRMNR